MTEALYREITEGTGLPADAYYCNQKIGLIYDSEIKRILADMGNPLKRRRPYWVPVSEDDIARDSAYQSTKEHQNGKWVREYERMGKEC